MAALWAQRIDLINAAIDKWQKIYDAEKDKDEKHMMITALLSAYAHKTPLEEFKKWNELLDNFMAEKGIK